MSQAQMEVFIQAELQTHRQAFEPGHVQDFLDIYLQSEHCSDEELQISGISPGSIFCVSARA